jgi:hypothetical protein
MKKFLIFKIDSSRGEIVDDIYEEGSELNFKDFCNELYRKVKVKKDEKKKGVDEFHRLQKNKVCGFLFTVRCKGFNHPFLFDGYYPSSY